MTKKTPVVLLTEDEIRSCAAMDVDSLGAVEQAFVWLSEGRVEMPPIMHMDVSENNGDIDIKSAYVRGERSIAVKAAAGFFDNKKLGLPNSSGMVVVLSAQTGRCEAVLLDNCYLTDLRTGLAGAVAARHLAPPAASVLGVIGAGAQARYQAEAFALVRPLTKILIAARSDDQLVAYQSEMSNRLGVPIETSRDVEHVVRRSDVLVTTTPSKTAIVKSEWLKAGQHITAMGSDLPGKQELDPGVLQRANVIVADMPAQSRTHGELQHVADETSLKSPPAALGDIVRGVADGRVRDDQITVCDLSGVGVQDTAISLHVLRAARARELGQVFQT